MITLGPMFRTEMLTLLGVRETIKVSKLSWTFRKTVDYNKYHDNQLPYLDKLIEAEPYFQSEFHT